eukprot:1500529-Amphidinium_carterae.1
MQSWSFPLVLPRKTSVRSNYGGVYSGFVLTSSKTSTKAFLQLSSTYTTNKLFFTKYPMGCIKDWKRAVPNKRLNILTKVPKKQQQSSEQLQVSKNGALWAVAGRNARSQTETNTPFKTLLQTHLHEEEFLSREPLEARTSHQDPLVGSLAGLLMSIVVIFLQHLCTPSGQTNFHRSGKNKSAHQGLPCQVDRAEKVGGKIWGLISTLC